MILIAWQYGINCRTINASLQCKEVLTAMCLIPPYKLFYVFLNRCLFVITCDTGCYGGLFALLQYHQM